MNNLFVDAAEAEVGEAEEAGEAEKVGVGVLEGLPE